MSAGLCKPSLSFPISNEDIENNFSDLHSPYTVMQAKAEAARCLYCYDAPCMTACPTSIDVPTFIHQIKTDNVNGSAKTILSQNIMGGTCSRACPTEILCEQACVLNASSQEPVAIGALQRFAVDHLLDESSEHPFKRKSLSGKKIAVIGAGPAGLSCAHRAAMLGHDVTVFEAKPKSGGLNEYGLAAYKMANDFAQKEVEFLLQIGGITIKHGKKIGENLSLTQLNHDFDAVFIGAGLASVNSLTLTKPLNANQPNVKVIDAIDFIQQLRQTTNKSSMNIGQDVIVIGAGNTAIDAAIQAKRLGAKNVSLVYRRGESSMSATPWEVDLARSHEIKLLFWSTPHSLNNDGTSSNIQFEKTSMDSGLLTATGEFVNLKTDLVLTAIGQKLDASIFLDDPFSFEIEKGKLVVTKDYQTSIKGFFAGGDCIASGDDLTVQAVEDGKQAAHAIDTYLSENNQISPLSESSSLVSTVSNSKGAQ